MGFFFLKKKKKKKHRNQLVFCKNNAEIELFFLPKHTGIMLFLQKKALKSGFFFLHWIFFFCEKNAEIWIFLLFAIKAAKRKLMHKIEKRFCLCFFCLLGHTPFSSGARLEGLGNRGIPFRLSGAARRPWKQRNPFPAPGCGAKASETKVWLSGAARRPRKQRILKMSASQTYSPEVCGNP